MNIINLDYNDGVLTKSCLLLAVVDDSQQAYQDAFEISKSKMQVNIV